jgi:hypothetical protein
MQVWKKNKDIFRNVRFQSFIYQPAFCWKLLIDILHESEGLNIFKHRKQEKKTRFGVGSWRTVGYLQEKAMRPVDGLLCLNKMRNADCCKELGKHE